MTTAMLSTHSSNPLEVSSSDPRNASYLRQIARAERMGNAQPSSDDPLDGYGAPEMEEYHSHLAKLYPNTSVLHNPKPDASRRPAARDMTVKQSEDGLSEEMLPDEDVGNAEDDQHQDAVTEEGVEEEDDDGSSSEDESDEDAPPYTDEENTILLKALEEQDEINEEIADLENTVPQLTPDYKIIDRLGTGTFSSVYKAIDLGYHSKWDNTTWHGLHPLASSAHYQSVARPRGHNVFVAVKRIYVTSGPERIRNEISIMEDCRGCRHVSQLITAFRHRDQIVAIMPYHRNEDFRDYYRILPMEGIKSYFRCMFRALRDIHVRDIIHRDVKPANFLFDPRTGIGTLCDFGLACRMEPGPTLGACLHTAPNKEYPHGRVRARGDYDPEHVKQMQKEGRLKSQMPSDKVGYPENDTRPHSKANRAGTRGFRAPEVLFKCGEQSGAIDVWAVGTILLFFLTGKFPIFHSNDDIEALIEIATIIGKRRLEKVATLHSRVFQSNLPTLTQDGITWRDFVEQLNPDLRKPRAAYPRFYPVADRTIPPTSSSSPTRYSPSRSSSLTPVPPDDHTYAADVESALDLLEQLMEPEAHRRITPRRALAHPFLREPDAPDDDEFAPNRWGEGVCREWHFYDAVSGGPCVQVLLPGEDEMEVRHVAPGQGIAIGRQPCEFHREEYGYHYS